jgi:cysteinyl-tRNA synthetase
LEFSESTEAKNEDLSKRIQDANNLAYDGMNDDLNTAVALAAMFELLKIINSLKGGQISMSELDAKSWELLRSTYNLFVTDIFGLIEEKGKTNELMNTLMSVILADYSDAKSRKDYATVDRIRAQVKTEGIVIKDSKTGVSWDYEE